MAVFLSVLSMLPYIVQSSQHMNHSRMAIWCKAPITSESRDILDSMAANISFHFNISVEIEILNLNYSAYNVYHILDGIESKRESKTKNEMFVVSNIGLKESWLWAKILGNSESVIVDIQHPKQEEISKSQFLLKNYVGLVPPKSEKMHIIEHMMDQILCKEYANIVCPQTEKFTDSLRSQLRNVKEQKYCIVVHCTEQIHEVFLLAKEYDLLGLRYYWFLAEFIKMDQKATALPDHVLTVELNYRNDESKLGDSGCGHENYLNDAFMVVAGLKSVYGTSLDRNMIGRNLLRTNFTGKTGAVYFNNSHIRKGSDYGIVQLIRLRNSTGWLRIGSWNNNHFDTSLKSWIRKEAFRVKPPLLRIATKHSKPWMFVTGRQEFKSETSKCNVGIKCINYTRYVTEQNNSYTSHCCSGMLVELLEELKERFPFTPRIHFVKDNKFGNLDTATNSWNGMIGEVLNDEADTALYSLTITETRSKVVEFTYPFLASGSGIIISTQRQKSFPHINNSFLRPFSTGLWVVTLGIFAACFLILWSAEGWNRKRMSDRYRRATHELGSFLGSMSYTWGVVVQKVVQEGGPKTFGGRIVTGVFGFYMIILLSTYTANLAAIQVAEEEEDVITGIYDDKFINPTNEFKFTSSKFTATSEFFKHSPDERMRRIYKIMKDRLVSTRAEARELLKSGEIQAFFEDTPSLQYMASHEKNCDLKVVGKQFGSSGYGMPFRRNSTWLPKFTKELRKMHEDGTINKLSQKWLQSGCVTKVPNTAKEVELRDESGLFYLLAVVSIGSFFILALEFICVRIFAVYFESHSRFFAYNVTT